MNELLEKAGKKIVLLNHIINLGQGAALQTGFEYARTLKPDVVITYDADGQFAAKDITKFILPIINKKCDVVLGSRFLGKAINMPLSRYIVLRLGIFCCAIFLRSDHIALVQKSTTSCHPTIGLEVGGK